MRSDNGRRNLIVAIRRDKVGATDAAVVALRRMAARAETVRRQGGAADVLAEASDRTLDEIARLVEERAVNPHGPGGGTPAGSRG